MAQWADLMALRQLLHALPSRLRLSVSPGHVERELTHLQDCHADLTARCKALTNALVQRLALWRRYDLLQNLTSFSIFHRFIELIMPYY